MGNPGKRKPDWSILWRLETLLIISGLSLTIGIGYHTYVIFEWLSYFADRVPAELCAFGWVKGEPSLVSWIIFPDLAEEHNYNCDFNYGLFALLTAVVGGQWSLIAFAASYLPFLVIIVLLRASYSMWGSSKVMGVMASTERGKRTQ